MKLYKDKELTIVAWCPKQNVDCDTKCAWANRTVRVNKDGIENIWRCSEAGSSAMYSEEERC